MPISPKDFGASFQQFMEQMASQAEKKEPVFVRRLREHFGRDPASLPVVSQSFPGHDHPNLQVALDSFLGGKERSADVLGIVTAQPFFGVTFSALIAPGMVRGMESAVGPVTHANVPLDGDNVLTCVQCGLFLIRDGERRLAVLIQGPLKERHIATLTVEVMAAERAAAEGFLAEIRKGMRERSIYRGRVLSLSQARFLDALEIRLTRLPEVRRESIILPAGLLERIERQTLGFSRHAPRLLAEGRHLRRGLLLHGPPGTGKTLTAMYLAGAMKERTVILLTGRGLGLIEQSCGVARALQPSTVILEDVDLVAEERTRQKGCATPVLFELLNEMDGLREEADVLFILTTNRADLLEPALAARPGRIDQAFEVPLPDAPCRRRLFDLYARGLTLGLASFEPFIARTEGASAAFIRELLRKAALFAAGDGEDSRVEDRHLDEAIRELVVEGGELTKSLLGYGAGSNRKRDEARPPP